MATFTEASEPQNHSKIWRHDRKDLDVMNVLFENELSSLTKAGHSKHYILHYMNIYKKGVMDMRKELVDIITEELIPENEKIGTDPDHWFEINLANCVLFPNLTLEGIGELLPGRLFTTRMPRDIITSPLAAEKFRQKKLFFNLDTALVLTETAEYAKYAGADLEEFYSSIGIKTIHRPIIDFSVPELTDIIQDIKDVTWLLAQGKNVLVHCAGGSGRTGMVIAGIVKSVGVRNPVPWIRRVKSTYVETEQQEKFVNSLPAVIDSKIAEKFPTLATVIAVETLQLARQHHHAVNTPFADTKSPSTVEELELSAEQIHDYIALFELYSNYSEQISKENLQSVLDHVGCSVPVEQFLSLIDNDGNGSISKFEFLLAFSKVASK